MQNHRQFKGVFVKPGKRGMTLYTKSFAPGKQVYKEKLVKEKGTEYREWDTHRSKLAAAIVKGISQMGIKPDSTVLYLGCASGTTSSHVSDIVGKEGFVWCLDFAPRTMRDMILVSEQRPNMTTIMEDANHPERYANQVLAVDAIFQDVAQKNQAEIFLKNCDMFLKKGGFGILCVKSRSIDISKKPKEIYKVVREQIEKKLMIVDYKELDPLEKDHCVFVCKKK